MLPTRVRLRSARRPKEHVREAQRDLPVHSQGADPCSSRPSPDAWRSSNEDQLSDLLGRVRRGRNKYSDLHRRQGAKSVRSAGKRDAAEPSNDRTLRKAEIFEDAISRVARYLSRAARSTANELKAERVAAARAGSGSSPSRTPATKKTKKKPTGTKQAKRSTDIVDPARKGSTSARTKRSQGSKDARR